MSHTFCEEFPGFGTPVPIASESDNAMPYYVYKISPPLRLTPVDTKDKYRDARALVRQLRQGQPAGQATGEPLQYRMIFANSQAEAEKLLSTPRDERVIGED